MAKSVHLPNQGDSPSGKRPPSLHLNINASATNAGSRGQPPPQTPPRNVASSPQHEPQSPMQSGRSPMKITTRGQQSDGRGYGGGGGSGEKHQGVVCSMKDSYGFIERADVVKEIFFHFSEFKGRSESDLELGDDVEFSVQFRNVSSGLITLNKISL